MKNKFLFIAIGVITILGISSCKKYLDVLPDNRAELNTTEKIAKMLVSAYPQNSYILATELSSDNADDYGDSNPYSDRMSSQIFNWQDVTETNNDGIDVLWGACYSAVASANAALAAIEEQGNPASLSAQRGEALVARAYSHFLLVNIFAQHYSPTKSTTDLGVTYMTKSETTLNPKYTRNTVAEVYDFMIKDLEAGIPLINDASYANANVAKFHFNKSAANAFAARLFLYKGDWAKAVSYATAAFSNAPAAYLRDWAYISTFSASFGNTSREYNASTIKANFLINTPASNIGIQFGPYYDGSRYSHGRYIADKETVLTPRTPHGNYAGVPGYRIRTYVYSGANLDKVLLPHDSYQFEITDPVAGFGFRRGVFVSFTAEEAILTRAEANIHLKNYAAAVADMQLFVNNTYTVVNPVVSESSINAWADGMVYSTAAVSTAKKKFNAEFPIEAGTQENMLHAVLYYKRIETLHTGLRWFDVKRYGIEITRRTIVAGAVGSVGTNTLVVRDNRRALQLPKDVISSGLTPNPR
nr:RagB/SusD family nutrient uptake outer membrane protein [uncultured Pedobacter sp.]